ncbi:hypothetical protein SUGI_0498170 [Cryptomeria japonica]|nr:hypothetical protein SUGI_0498170 [Cryptomeria japonica]
MKALMIYDLVHELIEPLEKIVSQIMLSVEIPNLQNLLSLTAIKADKSSLMDYINRLDIFDDLSVGEIFVGVVLYEEDFTIIKNFNLNVQAINVLSGPTFKVFQAGCGVFLLC